jgi:hypothetical protein
MLRLTPFFLLGASLFAGPVTWTDWTTADATSASGTIGSIGISFSGDINPAAQTGCGTDYWTPNTPYLSATVDNAPPPCDVVRLTGGAGTGTQTVTFSTPVTDPIFAILSLGQPSLPRTYDFDADFTILSSGTGFFGGSASGSLSKPSATVLLGVEGHGAIQFSGTYTSISWTIPDAEFWHGFTVGLGDQPTGGIPEPATVVLTLAGIASIGGLRFMRRARS